MDKVNFDNPFVIIFIAGTLISYFVRLFLNIDDFLARRKNGGILPEELKSIPAASVFNQEKLITITNYKNSRFFSALPHGILSVALTLILALSGFYPVLLNGVLNFIQGGGTPDNFGMTFLSAFLFFAIASIPESILSVPFELYDEFVIEKKYGFSKMTLKLWIMDQIKGLLVSLVLTSLLLLAMTGVMTLVPDAWWILLSVILFAFTLLLQVLYPLVIAPLFNKFSPLEDGELKTKLESLLEKAGFKSSGVFVVDASKRSGHSNAYFGGMGKSKRIVLYDTLIQQLTADELVAVLGHELGHYKLKHILKRFIFTIPVEIALMYVLYLFANTGSIYVGFGFPFGYTENGIISQNLMYVGLFLATLVWEPVSTFLSPVTNFFSRRDEYQADEFSRQLTGNPDALISGLIKLNSENLSELMPSKKFVFWNYSHPTLLERIANLRKNSEK